MANMCPELHIIPINRLTVQHALGWCVVRRGGRGVSAVFGVLHGERWELARSWLVKPSFSRKARLTQRTEPNHILASVVLLLLLLLHCYLSSAQIATRSDGLFGFHPVEKKKRVALSPAGRSASRPPHATNQFIHENYICPPEFNEQRVNCICKEPNAALIAVSLGKGPTAEQFFSSLDAFSFARSFPCPPHNCHSFPSSKRIRPGRTRKRRRQRPAE
ncbi:hypothetical protein EDC04DRAFT_1207259 [Pisolithus marmoratus]|nr:hypothetical protein EDC04DRAFT_1207259 [Pisolithus marmoratus]